MYQTKQKKILIEYFKNNTKKQHSINEIITSVCPEGSGKSTVYRLLSQLTSSGVLIKLHGKNSKSILYQYVGEGTECNSHFHLKCSECGSLVHLDCKHATEISKHIFDEHNFRLDMKKTVMYGICRSCSEKKEV